MITATNPPRFLIIQTAFIGDAILATALLEQLHATYPKAQLDLLVRKGNEGLLANHPFLNNVLIWHKKGAGGAFAKYRDLRRLLRIVRAQRYDAVLNLQRYATMGILTVLSGARITVGFDKNPLSAFFTHRVKHRIAPGIHEVDRNRELLNAINADTLLSTHRKDNNVIPNRPKLYPSTADFEAVRTYQTKPYVCVAPMSVWFTKQYPVEGWVAFIQALSKKFTIYLLGAPTDVAACDAIKTAANAGDNVVVLASKLSLLQSAALQQKASMNYVNDSAPLHLCSAMNAPTTAIFCSTSPDFGYGPLADAARVVETREKLDCKPCTSHGRNACPLGHYRCGYGIQTADLLFTT